MRPIHTLREHAADAVQLLVRADDSGASVSANRAVADCFDHGVLRNTSVMACGSALADAARRFSQRPGLCIGLHATLTSEWLHPRYRPVLPPGRVPSLVDADGCFLPSPLDLHTRGFDPAHARAELAAQHALLLAAGLRPAYLDEHMGVGWLPGLGDTLADLADRAGLVLATHHARQLPVVAAPDGLDPVRDVIARLDAVQNGRIVLITHPLHDDAEARAITNADHPPGQVAHRRDQDRVLLQSQHLMRYLEHRGIRTIRYDES